MRNVWFRLVTMSVCFTLAAASVAWAHTTVSPEEVPAGSTETFTVRAPGEKDIPIVQERVEVPEGFEVTDVPETSGWESELEQDASGATIAIVWYGGEIPPDETQEFAFEARTPTESGAFVFRAFDTYEDGSVEEWTGPEDSDSPASVVKVSEAGSRTDVSGAETEEHGDEHEDGHETTSPETTSGKGGLPKSGGVAPVVFYGGLGTGTLAVALTLAVVITTLRHRGRT